MVNESITLKTPKKKEVGCLALTFYYDYLESQGISREVLQKGLPYNPEYLNNRLNWISYNTLIEIERRIEHMFPNDPDIHYKIGRSIEKSKGFGFIRVVGRAVISPFSFYYRLPGVIKRFLFPFLDVNFQRIDRKKMQAQYVFNEKYPASDAFFDTVRGILTGVPVIFGASPANVRVTRISEYEALFDIELRNEWLGIFDFIRRLFGRIFATFKMRLRNLDDASAELLSTNTLLQEKVDALTKAKASLDNRVRDLSILNALSRAATTELELQPLLRNVISVISEQLGQIPAAILLAEGDQPGLVMGVSERIDKQQKEVIDALSDPRAPLTNQVVSDDERATFYLTISNKSWSVFPLRSQHRLVGALVLDIDEKAFESTLLESMISQLAVAVDNAVSYRLVTDLSNNLELRVRERTAELEVARGRLEDMVQRLRQADRAKADFFTNVSHEFKTPLTLILSPLEELEASLKRSGMLDHIEEIAFVRRNASILLRLITEILDFTKLEQGQIPIVLEKVSLQPIIDNIIINLKPLAIRKDVSLEYIGTKEQIDIVADPKLLHRALVNLIENAIKYCETGDNVTVHLDSDSEWIEIAVADTGPGIPKNQQSKVFERFQRVSDSTGRIIEGSGIGLAMVKDIVELHQGSITLDSDIDKGSVFRARLLRELSIAPKSKSISKPPPPIVDEYEVGSHLEQLSWAPSPATELPQQGIIPSSLPSTVLLVEDNEEMLDFMAGLLGRHHTVLTAANGREGLETARLKLPDVIVSDIMMPHMNGYEMCQKLKQDPMTRNISVILVTARHGPEAAVQGFSVGADDYVVKPFSSQELVARVGAQTRIRALTTSLIRAEKQTIIGTMSAGIAHEVLNPINAVINGIAPLRGILAEVLSERNHPKQREASIALLEAIETSGRRIHEVVNALLAFARPSENALKLKEAQLSKGVESALTILKFKMKKNTQVHCEYNWDEPILCYPELLNQAVINLIINAIDALPERGGNVWISTEMVDNTVEIRVKDDGPGIPSEYRERIFTPFYTTKPPGLGTGLGLAITQEIVSLHRGEITLLTESDPGTEFIISIPLILHSHEFQDGNADMTMA